MLELPRVSSFSQTQHSLTHHQSEEKGRRSNSWWKKREREMGDWNSTLSAREEEWDRKRNGRCWGLKQQEKCAESIICLSYCLSCYLRKEREKELICSERQGVLYASGVPQGATIGPISLIQNIRTNQHSLRFKNIIVSGVVHNLFIHRVNIIPYSQQNDVINDV